jgi:CRISPR-associated protein Cas1
MPLADDLMEPFRPIIDATVKIGFSNAGEDLTPEFKRRLVRTLFLDIDTERGITPLATCMQRLAGSLAELCLGTRTQLDIPPPPKGDVLRQRLQPESSDDDSDRIPAHVDDGDV